MTSLPLRVTTTLGGDGSDSEGPLGCRDAKLEDESESLRAATGRCMLANPLDHAPLEWWSSDFTSSAPPSSASSGSTEGADGSMLCTDRRE